MCPSITSASGWVAAGGPLVSTVWRSSLSMFVYYVVTFCYMMWCVMMWHVQAFVSCLLAQQGCGHWICIRWSQISLFPVAFFWAIVTTEFHNHWCLKTPLPALGNCTTSNCTSEKRRMSKVTFSTEIYSCFMASHSWVSNLYPVILVYIADSRTRIDTWADDVARFFVILVHLRRLDETGYSLPLTHSKEVAAAVTSALTILTLWALSVRRISTMSPTRTWPCLAEFPGHDAAAPSQTQTECTYRANTHGISCLMAPPWPCFGALEDEGWRLEDLDRICLVMSQKCRQAIAEKGCAANGLGHFYLVCSGWPELQREALWWSAKDVG